MPGVGESLSGLVVTTLLPAALFPGRRADWAVYPGVMLYDRLVLPGLQSVVVSSPLRSLLVREHRQPRHCSHVPSLVSAYVSTAFRSRPYAR